MHIIETISQRPTAQLHNSTSASLLSTTLHAYLDTMTENAGKPPQKALIVGISGPSSSGKTTLARLLQSIFCGLAVDGGQLHSFIVHEDDFYVPDNR